MAWQLVSTAANLLDGPAAGSGSGVAGRGGLLAGGRSLLRFLLARSWLAGGARGTTRVAARDYSRNYSRRGTTHAAVAS